jgi:hypothetical protein
LTSHRGSPRIGALKTRWRRWVDIVDLFARRRPGRGRVDPREYVALHKELIQECRTLAESADEVEGVYYRYLADLVQPWLTPSVLARADHDILVELLARCLQVERQLGVRAWSRMIPVKAPQALLTLLLAVAAILLISTIGGGGYSVLDWLRSWSDVLWIAVKRSSDVERLCLIGIILIFVSIFSVSRTARS